MTTLTAPFTVEPEHEWDGKTFIWHAVTIDGNLWAYRREWPGGHFDQFTPNSLRLVWWRGDVMRYFSPVQR
jgi:hypothetical protein